jgi:hypothetical protein
MLRWDQYDFDKKCIRRRYAELVFFHSEGSAGHKVRSGASGSRCIDTLFFMLGWDQYGFDKKCIGMRYTKPVFLHPGGSAGHVVCSCTSGAQNVKALFFMLWWDQYVFHKKRVGTVTPNLCFCIPRDLRDT